MTKKLSRISVKCEDVKWMYYFFWFTLLKLPIYKDRQKKKKGKDTVHMQIRYIYSAAFSSPFHENMTLLYLQLELQESQGKEQLDTLLGFMLYIRRPRFPLSEYKRK